MRTYSRFAQPRRVRGHRGSHFTTLHRDQIGETGNSRDQHEILKTNLSRDVAKAPVNEAPAASAPVSPTTSLESSCLWGLSFLGKKFPISNAPWVERCRTRPRISADDMDGALEKKVPRTALRALESPLRSRDHPRPRLNDARNRRGFQRPCARPEKSFELSVCCEKSCPLIVAWAAAKHPTQDIHTQPQSPSLEKERKKRERHHSLEDASSLSTFARRRAGVTWAKSLPPPLTAIAALGTSASARAAAPHRKRTDAVAAPE